MLRYSVILDSVGAHENDPTTEIEMLVRFASDKELATRVESEHTVEFFL